MYNNLKIGDTILGTDNTKQYQLVEMIGRGRFGEVFKIIDEKHHLFALKIIADDVQESELKSLFNEGSLHKIEHKNVIKVFFFHDGTLYPHLQPYIIMEYADGGTLEQMLRDRTCSGILFNNNKLKTMFLELASGMKAINEKVVHRDIKPNNILLLEETLKITDFGISKIMGANTRSGTFKGWGTYRYAAPEYWDNSANQPPMDMYSMGIVFYEIATLKHPYFGPDDGNFVEEFRRAHREWQPIDIRKYNCEINIGLIQLISKMMSKSPNQRPDSWDTIIDVINYSDSVKKSYATVNQLLEISVQKRLEKNRIENENRTRITNQREFENCVVYSFGKIVTEIQKLVDDFNKGSVDRKLRCNFNPDIKFRVEISASGHGHLVVIVIEPVHIDVRVEGKQVLAWGHVKAPSKKGNNLLLIASDEDDPYGNWEWWHVEKNAGMGSKDTRLEPIPLEFKELPDRIRFLNDLDLYKINRHPFEEEKIGDRLEEWLAEIV